MKRSPMIRLLTLLILTALSQPAYSQVCRSYFADSNLEQSLTNLVKEEYVAGQEHAELGRSGYLLKDGGLCGPTSVTIILRALERLAGVVKPVLPEDIMKATDQISRTTRDDARGGVHTHHLAKFLERKAKSLGFNVKVSAEGLSRDGKLAKRGSFREDYFKSKSKDTVYILVTNVYSQHYSKAEFIWGHFSVGYGFDAGSMTIKVIDPLHPKKEITAKLLPIIEPDSQRASFAIEYDRHLPVAGFPSRPLIHLIEVIKLERQ